MSPVRRSRASKPKRRSRAAPTPRRATPVTSRKRAAVRPRSRPRAASAPRPVARAGRATGAARSRGAAGALGITGVHVSFTSHLPEPVRRFYVETLALGSHAEDPALGYQLVRPGAGATLGFGPALPGPPEAWRPPREPMVVFEVRDVDRVHRNLVARGVVFVSAPTDMAWGQRIAILRDPEGRTLCFAQPISRRARPRA
jgi:catechol 2,3-dioxygenase-like lactoylglutathione lyase family enzyme